MAQKNLPLSAEQLTFLTSKYHTPFYLYSETNIRDRAKSLREAFEWAPDFKQYFAVKATPTPKILRILHEEGMGMDCSSFSELALAKALQITGEQIMFSSNYTPLEEYEKALALGAIINLDDVGHIKFLENNLHLPDVVSLRYNPGPLKQGNEIIGKPEESKFGSTRSQIIEGLIYLKNKGVNRLGIHTMVASNELDEDYFSHTAKMMFDFAAELNEKHSIIIDFVNLGGGIGVPYHPEQKAPSYKTIGLKIKTAYNESISNKGLSPIKLFLEMGRSVTASSGWLVSKVEHVKRTYKNYIGLDSNMANLMRPGMYGSYHHIEILGKNLSTADKEWDVVGSLCENNDKFAINRKLPTAARGDIVVIHDVGAHGHSMGFNYNGKLRSSEVLLNSDGSAELIRRAETIDDYFKTMVF